MPPGARTGARACPGEAVAQRTLQSLGLSNSSRQSRAMRHPKDLSENIWSFAGRFPITEAHSSTDRSGILVILYSLKVHSD